MTKVLIALWLAAATAAAQEAQVTPLMTHELAGIDGKEGTLIMVEYAPGGSDAEHRHHQEYKTPKPSHASSPGLHALS